MPDALLCRAELAIQEARKLRDERDALDLNGELIRTECRRALLASYMVRTEVRGYQEDKEQGRQLATGAD
ncbi:hypothetical protein [Bradyrhizobium sp. 141]|uniref:hypothetical protein n=1 Tax=Bradyrhizobium sp. 141 TaxID=2782617 RepID=UPI001FFB30CA|nr:hypothetical protein [Bradyrhizobium sp. 141]MCK1721319.1 hypothetical protein [Bradyrhizobium sp. 141]